MIKEKEQLMKKAAKLTEEHKFDEIGPAEMFVRKKMAQYLMWERKNLEHLIANSIEARVKICIEIEFTDRKV